MNARERATYEINETSKLLGFNEDAVKALIYDYGVKFSERYYGPRSARLAQGCALYWTWWIVSWNQMDKWIRRHYPITALEGDAWKIYKALHDPGRIVIGVKTQPWTEVTRQVNELLTSIK